MDNLNQFTAPLNAKPASEPKVSDLMSTELFTLYQTDNLNVLDELMKWQRIRHVPVVNENLSLTGLVTHRDFLKVAISRLAEINDKDIRKAYKNIQVRDIMKTDVITVLPETSLEEAAKIMNNTKYGCLPVIQGEKLLGLITEADFVKAFYEWEASFVK